VKKTGLLFGFAVLTLTSALGQAAVKQGVSASESHQFDAVPLMQWEEPELLAEQLPAPATPTPPAVTPPATTAQPVPAPSAQPPAAPDAAAPEPMPPAPGDVTDPADPNAGPADGATDEDMSPGDVPEVETIELTPDTARKALDTYLLVRDKYKDAELENYENLQDFVDQAPQGKAFEADVKAAGFPNVTEWNTSVTSLSFAYDNSINDQTADTKQQIAELEKDTETAADMRERMIKALKAMIPSDNNKKVLEDMKADPVWAEKLKILETETE
jgi:hypothetical protein